MHGSQSQQGPEVRPSKLREMRNQEGSEEGFMEAEIASPPYLLKVLHGWMDDPSLSLSQVRVLVLLGPRVWDEAVEQIQQSGSNSVGLVFFERHGPGSSYRTVWRRREQSRGGRERPPHYIGIGIGARLTRQRKC